MTVRRAARHASSLSTSHTWSSGANARAPRVLSLHLAHVEQRRERAPRVPERRERRRRVRARDLVLALELVARRGGLAVGAEVRQVAVRRPARALRRARRLGRLDGYVVES